MRKTIYCPIKTQPRAFTPNTSQRRFSAGQFRFRHFIENKNNNFVFCSVLYYHRTQKRTCQSQWLFLEPQLTQTHPNDVQTEKCHSTMCDTSCLLNIDNKSLLKCYRIFTPWFLNRTPLSNHTNLLICNYSGCSLALILRY